jgi:hypothetical protein
VRNPRHDFQRDASPDDQEEVADVVALAEDHLVLLEADPPGQRGELLHDGRCKAMSERMARKQRLGGGFGGHRGFPGGRGDMRARA